MVYKNSRLEKRLIDENMTKTWLAKKLNISTTFLSVIISGRRPGRKYRLKIAQILNCNYEDIWKD